MEISDNSEAKMKAEAKSNMEEDISSRIEVSVMNMFVISYKSLCV